MPRSRSIFIQSERVLRRSPLALTWPARLMAPPNSRSFSVSVVLPASGWEMIAKVRRRATSEASGERDGCSVVTARSDMAVRLAGKIGGIKGGFTRSASYSDGHNERQSASSSLERDGIGLNRHRALALCLSMIFSENRYTLFRIMLCLSMIFSENRYTLFRIML